MIKTVVAVCIYNRFDNLRLWVNCWQQCETEDAELVIIHNYYGDAALKKAYQDFCQSKNIKYIPRNKPGFDIGAFQDVCKNRLPGFPEDFENLIWCCDDTLPMTKTFVHLFIKRLTPENGIAAMEISNERVTHVRTTGFAIKKATMQRLKWAVDPITTKEDCWFFEHRGGTLTLYKQILQMGLKCVMLSMGPASSLWDTGHRRKLNRWQEFYKVFKDDSIDQKVVFICPIYNMYPQIISSLLCQTYQNWELQLIHNGPLNGFKYDIPEDPRIKFTVHPIETGTWGHHLRAKALKELTDGDFVVITNADNYHVPGYCERLLHGFKIFPGAKAIYHDGMIHNYTKWQYIKCRLERGFIDSAGVMVRRSIAQEVGWNSLEHSSDWIYFSEIIKRYGLHSFQMINGCLLVHN